MNGYLKMKIGEEASEVSQAAFKNLLHNDKQSLQDLLSEMADLEAMVTIARRGMTIKQRVEFAKMVATRINREEAKGKV